MPIARIPIEIQNNSSTNVMIVIVDPDKQSEKDDIIFARGDVIYDNDMPLFPGNTVTVTARFITGGRLPAIIFTDCHNFTPLDMCFLSDISDDNTEKKFVLTDNRIAELKKQSSNIKKIYSDVTSQQRHICISYYIKMARESQSWHDIRADVDKDVAGALSLDPKKLGNTELVYSYMQNCLYSFFQDTELISPDKKKMQFFLYKIADIDPTADAFPRLKQMGEIMLDASQVSEIYDLSKVQGGVTSSYTEQGKAASSCQLTYASGWLKGHDGSKQISLMRMFLHKKDILGSSIKTTQQDIASPVLIGHLGSDVVMGIPYELAADEISLPNTTGPVTPWLRYAVIAQSMLAGAIIMVAAVCYILRCARFGRQRNELDQSRNRNGGHQSDNIPLMQLRNNIEDEQGRENQETNNRLNEEAGEDNTPFSNEKKHNSDARISTSDIKISTTENLSNAWMEARYLSQNVDRIMNEVNSLRDNTDDSSVKEDLETFSKEVQNVKELLVKKNDALVKELDTVLNINKNFNYKETVSFTLKNLKEIIIKTRKLSSDFITVLDKNVMKNGSSNNELTELSKKFDNLIDKLEKVQEETKTIEKRIEPDMLV
ncbi:hypothetical protein [Photorhabdus antumapuensis]|uniref:hypothetical protein n=1 Tax=Photorhabdus antumapuensis TaxID=2862867 RepID=UPI001CEDB702|nr:hypothetical protein [Photorhabdus antumapuensis]MCA6220320.1 hypothetical protein [Photorhabdus antumapuensis]